jgi:hypothetical protein
MPYWLIALYLLHIGAALYWLGSSFLTALAKGTGAERQFLPQMIAAGLAMALGVVLWRELHPSGVGKMETVLGVGVVFALAAAGVQGPWVGGALRRLRSGAMTETTARKRITLGYRISAILLALALMCMVGSYHV